MRTRHGATALILVAALFSMAPALADGSGDPTAVKNEDGKYFDKQGNPTYKIQPDGIVDYYTYSGFVRYHSECHVCHGPDGMGSSYAPALVDSLKTMNYGDFLGVVAGGTDPRGFGDDQPLRFPDGRPRRTGRTDDPALPGDGKLDRRTAVSIAVGKALAGYRAEKPDRKEFFEAGAGQRGGSVSGYSPGNPRCPGCPKALRTYPICPTW